MKKTTFYNRHLKENEMSYYQHLRFALMLSRKTFGCVIASTIHAIIPFVMVTHTSSTIESLNEIFEERRLKQSNQSESNHKKHRK
jgi:hypothetical protein